MRRGREIDVPLALILFQDARDMRHLRIQAANPKTLKSTGHPLLRNDFTSQALSQTSSKLEGASLATKETSFF
jgi:hypothetical protein